MIETTRVFFSSLAVSHPHSVPGRPPGVSQMIRTLIVLRVGANALVYYYYRLVFLFSHSFRPFFFFCDVRLAVRRGRTKREFAEDEEGGYVAGCAAGEEHERGPGDAGGHAEEDHAREIPGGGICFARGASFIWVGVWGFVQPYTMVVTPRTA